METPPFQGFLDAHREPVYRFLVAAVGPEEADDCFQETFLAALRAYPRLEPGSNLRAWVMTIAHRKSIDAHRSRRRRPAPLADPPASTSEQAHDGQPELWRAVRELPDKQRAAIMLRFVGDLVHSEIGDVIGCSEQAARRSLHEGLNKLREVWKT